MRKGKSVYGKEYLEDSVTQGEGQPETQVLPFLEDDPDVSAAVTEAMQARAQTQTAPSLGLFWLYYWFYMLTPVIILVLLVLLFFYFF